MIYENNNYDSRLGKIFAALCVALALVGACWFLAYRAYTTEPTTEVITVQLPPGVMASNVVLVASPEQATAPTEIVREKPERRWFSALLHPLGFGVLLLVIIGAGGGIVVILLVSLRSGGEQ